MSSLKLGVEAISAHNLMPEDGEGTSNHFVELQFDGQRGFVPPSPESKRKISTPCGKSPSTSTYLTQTLSNLHLDAYVYRNVKVKGTRSRSILGKVRLTERSFVPAADAVISHYPLEKPSMLSCMTVKGELALIVYLTDDPTLKPSNLLPAIGPSARQDLLANQTTQPHVHVSNPTSTTAPVSNDRAESSHTNQNQQHSSTTASSQKPVDCTLKES
ncbi:hypothetical protein AAC387_Pa11g0318 [Persea americana]